MYKKEEALHILKHYFGYDSFREGQEFLIEHMMNGRDVFGIMPTGAGKSLCYQIPALLMPGITLVISPLISLMKDQVAALNQAGVHAAFLNSSLTQGQYLTALRYAKEGRYKIIYVAPERLLTESFLGFARDAEISMVSVDEAHCVSQWAGFQTELFEDCGIFQLSWHTPGSECLYSDGDSGSEGRYHCLVEPAGACDDHHRI